MYTNIHIGIYFGLWEYAIVEEEQGSAVWKLINNWFSRRHGVE